MLFPVILITTQTYIENPQKSLAGYALLKSFQFNSIKAKVFVTVFFSIAEQGLSLNIDPPYMQLLNELKGSLSTAALVSIAVLVGRFFLTVC